LNTRARGAGVTGKRATIWWGSPAYAAWSYRRRPWCPCHRMAWANGLALKQQGFIRKMKKMKNEK
jgi:hypothetical protein